MDKAKAWIDDFRQKNGRAPKILHIGNIANNAYQNAKMLIERGADCDVLCADYYHAMSCPEWDDADFSGDFGVSNFPAWQKTNLNGFKRPKWFVQGPISICNNYLLEKNKCHPLRAAFWWRRMNRFRICQSQDAMHDDSFNGASQECMARYADSFYFQRILHIVQYFTETIQHVLHNPGLFLLRIPTALRKMIETLLTSKAERMKTFNKHVMREQKEEQKRTEQAKNWMQKEIDALFPQQAAAMGMEAYGYYQNAQSQKEVMAAYDLIIGYASSCVYPYLAGFQNYIAYEHGTIRDFPYADSDLSRLTLLAYANAAAIYSTNTDCYESAQYIAAPKHTPVICGLHGIDLERVAQKQQQAERLSDIDGRFGAADNQKVILCPARHDFDSHYGAFLKGTDKLIRAAARLADITGQFKLVLLDWGNDVEKSKKLVAEHPKLEKNVIWHSPIPKKDLNKVYGSVDAIADQFFLHVFGGIALETLAAPNSVLISATVEEERQCKYFGEPIPMLPCYTEEEIFLALKQITDGTIDTEKLAAAGQLWLKQHHSKDCIMDKLGEALQLCVS